MMADIVARLAGKWRIVETAAWDKQHLDLCGPTFIEIDAQGRGEMAFGALEASLDCGFTHTGVDFEWNGADEGDQVSGDGWADLRNDGCLEGEIAYHNGDKTTFIAAPWARFFLIHRHVLLVKETHLDRVPRGGVGTVDPRQDRVWVRRPELAG